MRKRCDICSKIIDLSTYDAKFLDRSGPYVCCLDCVADWIRSQSSKADVSNTDVPIHSDGFRSNFEVAFFDWAVAQGFEIFHEPFIFQIDKTHSYTPDFFFPDYGCFIETKGKWNLGQREKFEQFRLEYPEIPILVVPWTIGREM